MIGVFTFAAATPTADPFTMRHGRRALFLAIVVVAVLVMWLNDAPAAPPRGRPAWRTWGPDDEASPEPELVRRSTTCARRGRRRHLTIPAAQLPLRDQESGGVTPPHPRACQPELGRGQGRRPQRAPPPSSGCSSAATRSCRCWPDFDDALEGCASIAGAPGNRWCPAAATAMVHLCVQAVAGNRASWGCCPFGTATTTPRCIGMPATRGGCRHQSSPTPCTPGRSRVVDAGLAAVSSDGVERWFLG